VRLGILDVGSNTVHLLVVDAEPGACPVPAADRRWDSPLLRRLNKNHEITENGEQELLDIVHEARDYAAELGVADLSAFGTSALREATNADELVLRIRDASGLDLHILDGNDEARLTFLAARRWFGWASGRLLVVDIGGGSLELSIGPDERPEHVASLPLGASRLTRDRMPEDPPDEDDVAALRSHVTATVAARLRPFRAHPVDLAAGTSKTLRSLARIAGAAPSSDGSHVPRFLSAADADGLVEKLTPLTVKDRAQLPGVSIRRAPQLLAGAIVAAATMSLLEIDALQICPWALREGVILTREDWIHAF
jgi:exopolyphosphatase/guanosine-5'-triphosphate,3'-diphosphate pyrophosphatase